MGKLLPGSPILPEIIGREPMRQEYIDALGKADTDIWAPIVELVNDALTKQLA